MRLDEWQKYLEGEFLDEPEDVTPAKWTQAVELPDSNSQISPLQPDSTKANADHWIPQKSAFECSPVMLSANVSVSTPLGLKNEPAPSCDDQTPCNGSTSCDSANRPQTKRRNRVPTDVVATADQQALLPEESLPGPTFASEVPRHVRQLLELRDNARRNDHEVAQSSYKRPFQETRQELIARLLDPVLSLEEAARLLNVCPTTIRRYTNRGLLNYYRKEPDRTSKNEQAGLEEAGESTDRETRQRRFRLSDILAFLELQKCGSVEP